MNWKALFKGGDIISAADKAELERLDKGTEAHRKLCDRIKEEFITSMDRIGRLQGLAGILAENPNDEKTYQKMLFTAAMPSNLQTGFQHRDAALQVIEDKIKDLAAPQHVIVRKCLKKALAAAEEELRRVEKKEKDEAKAEEFDYVPSGRVLALQQKVLGLRNEVARPIPGEELYNGLAHWTERLKEWL